MILIALGSNGCGANVPIVSRQWMSGQVDVLPRIGIDLLISILIHGTLFRVSGRQRRLSSVHEVIQRSAWGSCIWELEQGKCLSGGLDSVIIFLAVRQDLRV